MHVMCECASAHGHACVCIGQRLTGLTQTPIAMGKDIHLKCRLSAFKLRYSPGTGYDLARLEAPCGSPHILTALGPKEEHF